MDFPAPIASVAEMKRQRLLHNMSQADLAAVLGASRETVSRIESGVRPLTLMLARYLALVFEHMDKKAPAVPPKPKPSRYNPKSYYNFTTLDQQHLRLEQVDALPLGTHYRVQQDFKGWRTCVRGAGSRWDDDTVRAEAEMSNAAWVDATAKRFGEE